MIGDDVVTIPRPTVTAANHTAQAGYVVITYCGDDSDGVGGEGPAGPNQAPPCLLLGDRHHRHPLR